MNGAAATPVGKVLLVDDHEIVREGLLAILQREPRFRVVGSVATGEEAIAAAERLRPDVIIMDLVLPGLNGIDATKSIVAAHPSIRVIALSAHHTAEHVRRAMGAGAHGYVVKSAVGDELLQAVKMVTAGYRFVSPSIMPSFVNGLVNSPIAKSSYERLSGREREVLLRIVTGASSAKIAEELSLSRKTVDTYRSRLMLKLGVPDRSALIRLTIEHDLTAS